MHRARESSVAMLLVAGRAVELLGGCSAPSGGAARARRDAKTSNGKAALD